MTPAEIEALAARARRLEDVSCERFNELRRAQEIMESLKREREASITRPINAFRERAVEVLAKYNVHLDGTPMDALATAMQRLAVSHIREFGEDISSMLEAAARLDREDGIA